MPTSTSRGEVFSTWSLQSYLATGALPYGLLVVASHRQFRDHSPYWDFVESGAGIAVGTISVGNIRNP